MRLCCLSLITILALTTVSLPASAQDAATQKTPAKKKEQNPFVKIFNGKDLTGWKGRTDLWTVEDGAITGRTTADKPLKFNTFLIWEDGQVSNFDLQFEYKIQGGNSGVQYRSKILSEEDFVVGGYQADIDATMKYAGINYEEKGRGILAQRGQRVTIAKDGEKTVEEFGDAGELGQKITSDWNKYRVVAKGNKLSHYINGELMSEVIDDQTEEAGKKGAAVAEGVLAFQVHQGDPMVIQFKNVRIKRLK